MTASTAPGTGKPWGHKEPPPPRPARMTHPQMPCRGRVGGCCAGWSALANKGTTPGALGRLLHWLRPTSDPAEPEARGSGLETGVFKQLCPLHTSSSHLDTKCWSGDVLAHSISLIHLEGKTSFKNAPEENHRGRFCSFKSTGCVRAEVSHASELHEAPQSSTDLFHSQQLSLPETPAPPPRPASLSCCHVGVSV